ncbi:hypothetical protein NQ314_007057 [Rhamnusium bicolor]|uniref:Cyclic nucleotide-binding domain-containing protein n=1 Tax=Rhamnusium bicolor TaxID=1586634 RepID=A0AAV8YSB4_9CUCU|nr:hypothetical protein NQ314_007057 [Rhamnusium bicolor]
MSQNLHVCSLPYKDTSGFPKLAPNASRCRRLLRNFRKFLAMDPNNTKCKLFFRNRSSLIAEQRRHARSPYYFVIHPFSKLGSFLELTFFFIWFYSIITMPLDFDKTQLPDACIFIDNYIVIPVQYLLVISFFFLGYEDKKNKEIVIDPKKIICHYLKTYFFFDLISSDYSIIISDKFFNRSSISELSQFKLKVVRSILQMFCYYVRIGTLLDYGNGFCHSLKLSREYRFIHFYITKTYFFIHMLACLLYFVPEVVYAEDFPKETWLYQAKIQPKGRRNLIHVYSECILMSTCYFLGASQGNYRISVAIDEMCLSVVTLFGRLYTLFLLADVLRMFGIASVSESRYEQRLTQLEEYMSSKKLPEHLRNRLLKYYEYKLQKRYFNEREIISTLSEHLRTELFLFSARKLIQKASIFRTLPKATLGTIVASMKSETYSPRDVIISVGAVVEDVYFISSGTVAVSNEDGLELCHLEDGDEFGITTFLTENVQRYAHVAVEATEVFYINKSLFLGFIQTHSESMKVFEATVKKRLTSYEQIEEHVKKGGVDLLSELHAGLILERLLKRPIPED